mmetsp:Transcript_9806/g.59690  ORF Transcript_9806/g.59690 Transcript_9806/m.59690 type:complete len:200 (-) Transcript_9806:4727-5326(-)
MKEEKPSNCVPIIQGRSSSIGECKGETGTKTKKDGGCPASMRGQRTPASTRKERCKPPGRRTETNSHWTSNSTEKTWAMHWSSCSRIRKKTSGTTTDRITFASHWSERTCKNSKRPGAMSKHLKRPHTTCRKILPGYGPTSCGPTQDRPKGASKKPTWSTKMRWKNCSSSWQKGTPSKNFTRHQEETRPSPEPASHRRR